MEVTLNFNMIIFIRWLLLNPIVIRSLFSNFPSYSQSNLYGPDIFVADPGFQVVGYLSGGNFNKIDLLELDKITDLCLAFAHPGKDGTLQFRNGVRRESSGGKSP